MPFGVAENPVVYVETLPQCGQGTVAFKLDIKTPKLIFLIKLLKRIHEFDRKRKLIRTDQFMEGDHQSLKPIALRT